MRGRKGGSRVSEMNRGAYLSSLGQQQQQQQQQQQLVMGGSPSWWSMGNLKQASDEASPLFHPLPPPSSSFSQHPGPSISSPLSSAWYENYDLQQAWMSQLLLGGLAAQEERCSQSAPFHVKKMQDWESQLIFHSRGDQVASLKQETSEDSGYAVSHGSSSSWSQILPVSPGACDASSFSSSMLNFSSSKSGRKHHEPDHSPECNSKERGVTSKKARVQGSLLHQPSSFKVKKEKLGDRVTALHQLVSPFGKTDTASVLLEAIGYIRFLHSQIEALSSPYLAKGSGNMRQPVHEERNYIFLEDPDQDGRNEQKKDLRSRGLCLVPVSCTSYMESNNGADYWAPSIGGGF